MSATIFAARRRARLRRARFVARLAALACALALPGVAAAAPRVLTLEGALGAALARHPSVAGARLEVTAADALAREAARRPPARLEAEAENWGGPSGGPTLETTASVGWTVELGGDRGARRAVAGAGASAARAELELRRRDLRAAVAADFVAAWAAQQRRAALREAADDAAGAIDAARERLRAGAAPAIEVARAESDAARARAELARTDAALDAARRSLAAHWGDDVAAFDSLALGPPDAADAPAAEVPASHPALAVAAAARLGAEADARAARARRVPDLDVSLGARRFREDGTTGFVAALALPLGAAGGGEATAARARADRAALEREAATRTLRAGARNAAAALDGALAAWRELSRTAAPRAGEALTLLRAGYRAGRFGYVDLAEGRRAALESRVAVIDAAADAWRARAELDRYVGADPAPAEGEVSR